MFETTNPYTGETLKTFETATAGEITQAIGDADAAFQQWRMTSFAKRVEVMRAAAQILRRDTDKYAPLLTVEMGKLIAEAHAEVELSAAIFDYYADNAERLLAPEKLPVTDPAEGDAVLVHDPLGVLLAIEPWNFPYYQIARIIAPQLSAGNTILLKHAANVPQCAAAFEELMLEAGLPKHAFINLYVDHDHVQMILDDPRVQGVALTGSEAAGAAVASAAGRALKKSTMELGGADAFIVLKDADLEKTVKWAVFGRHWNGGQVCVSSKRMIIADESTTNSSKAIPKVWARCAWVTHSTLRPLWRRSLPNGLRMVSEK